MLVLMLGPEVAARPAEVGAELPLPLLQVIRSGVKAERGRLQRVHHGAGRGGGWGDHRLYQRQQGARAKGGVDYSDGGGGGLQGVLELLGVLFPFGVLPPVGLGEDALFVGVKSSFGGALQLGDSLLDVVPQHLRGSHVCKGCELVQGGLAMIDPVNVSVGGVGDLGSAMVVFS